MDDEIHYLTVIEELKQGPPRPGLWVKAMALSDGNEGIARSRYILLPVEQLKSAQRIERTDKFFSSAKKVLYNLKMVAPRLLMVLGGFIIAFILLVLIAIFCAR